MHERLMSIAEPTPDLATKIEVFVRAGTSPVSAAKAAGIDHETFESWMQQADAEPGPARDLRDKIAVAETEAQAADSEIELRKKNPNAWLSRKRRAQPDRPHRAPSKSIALQETLGGLTVKHRQFVTEYLKRP